VQADAPLVLHLVDRLPGEGRDDSLFKLLRQMPAGRYRHVVLTLQGDVDCELRHNGATVQVMSLSRSSGLGWSGCLRLYRLLRRLRPDLMHTRSLRAQLLAAMAGIRIRLPNAQPADSAPPRHGLSHWLADALGACQIRIHPAHGAIDSTRSIRAWGRPPPRWGRPVSCARTPSSSAPSAPWTARRTMCRWSGPSC
jgi:hypothetical protein